MNQTGNGTIFRWEGEKTLSLAEVVADLQEALLLPDRETWWFAWREVEIELPRQLRDVSEIPSDWNVLHVFSPYAEFRQLRRGRGWQWLLLTEKALPNQLCRARTEKPADPVSLKRAFYRRIRALFDDKSPLDASPEEGFGHLWRASTTYRTISSRRIMWGNKLRLPATEQRGVQEGRGVVTFPRPLEYKLAGEGANTYHQALVAEVQLYFDQEARQQTVRYKRLRHLPPGHDSARVEPLDKVMKRL